MTGTLSQSFKHNRGAAPAAEASCILWFTQSTGWNLFIDLSIIFNIIVVGLEVDADESLDTSFLTMRIGILVWYVLEISWRAAILRDAFVKGGNLFDIAIVTVALIGVLVPGAVGGPQEEGGWGDRLWRLSILRGHRFGRILAFARNFRPLMDLWLVLQGLTRAFRALVWFAVILFATLYGGGAIMTGVFKINDEGHTIDVNEYFGTVNRSIITLLQLATLDNWSSSVVRPLMGTNPFAATLLLIFVIGTAYGLLSLAVGVLVWSTVELARSHQDHGSHKAIKEDEDIIVTLRQFFEATLAIEEKDGLTLRDFQDAMQLPQVAHAIRQLDLPVSDIKHLHTHLDKRRCGEVTAEEFEKGCLLLKMPASRFDVACLTANIGGSVTYVSRLENRCDDMMDELTGCNVAIARASKELNEFRLSMGDVPEVGLRKDGRIKMGPPQKASRYTEDGYKQW